MSKKRRARYGRDAPVSHDDTGKGAAFSAFVDGKVWQELIRSEYRPVMDCPEVSICINIYADLISSMTLHLMASGDNGDTRIKDGLSRKLDIEPARNMTRSTFMAYVVRELMTTGNAVVIPSYDGDYLDDLMPVPSRNVSYTADKDGYIIHVNGKDLRPDEVLHFVLKPCSWEPWRGEGYRKAIEDAVKGIRQSNATRKALMESPAPSIIVKVDGLTQEFADAEGRKKLRKQYLDSSDSGEPWFIPSEAFSVEQVKPLTLNDLAIAKNLEIDKRAVAAVFGVPPFMVGVGDFKLDEYRLFLATRVMAVAKVIEQELTKKLLYSDQLYWKFNFRSLYGYSLAEIKDMGATMVDRMAMTRNEWRDWLGMSPGKGMDELLALENYIPVDRLGDQKKLKEGGDDDA